MRQWKAEDLTMEAYQLQPPDILVILQVRFEVQLIHEFEDEGERVLMGGINPGERQENIVAVGEATVCQRLLEQPLRIPFSKQTHCGNTQHSPSRWASNSTRNSTYTI